MRKNKMMRFASGLLVATLLTTSIISGTFAKYTSNASATDSARVAKWSFTVGGKDIAKSEEISFDLFNTVNEEDAKTAEGHIQTTDGTIIAPGTGGSFDIVLENKSEVTAKYAIDFTETKNTTDPVIPIEYSTDGTTWKSDINDLDITADDTKTALTFNGGTATIKVYWRWAYDATTPVRGQSDDNDTKLGVAGTGKVEVKAEITATQVN